VLDNLYSVCGYIMDVCQVTPFAQLVAELRATPYSSRLQVVADAAYKRFNAISLHVFCRTVRI